MRWSEAVTTEFVKTYVKHECLWNPEHPCYKMRFEREKAYQKIVKQFKAATSKDLCIVEVKNKIKNLRTTYVQQVHKILQKSSPDSMYEPSLVWFHEMDRCLKYVPMNRHNTSQQTSEVDSSCQIFDEQESPNEDTEDLIPDPLTSQDNDYESSHESNIKQERSSSPVYKKIKKKKFKRHRSPAYFVPDSNSEQREDEFDIYGKYIASQLRGMELQNALRLQLEIQSLVSKARISNM